MAKTPTPPAPEMQIRSRTGAPRRRAGLVIPAQWTSFDPDALTPEQGAAIIADTHLDVRVAPDAPPAAA